MILKYNWEIKTKQIANKVSVVIETYVKLYC